VMVGNVPMGSDHPIRIQTMTTSDTKDVAKTVEEVCDPPNMRCNRG
jgi:(E)-4-hydroxy-3-methylbut-2-enyl-diphosphate synthase